MKRIRAMKRETLKVLLPLAVFAAGFTLITVGIGMICGAGAGLIAAGAGCLALTAPVIARRE